MENTRHYSKAPITEALIDIQVQLPPSVNLGTLNGLFDEVKERYPRKRDRVYFQSQFVAGEAAASTSQHAVMGYSFHSQDERQVFQARLDGFTFSRLKPYESWRHLKAEAKKLWQLYRRTTEPVEITRVAVRVINQIDVPLPMVDFKDYLRIVPDVSSDLPQALSGMFMQLQFPQEDFQGLLVLRQAMTPPPSPEFVSIILDIDVFRQVTGLHDEDHLWDLLETLSKRKNTFFEGSITDKARALFD